MGKKNILLLCFRIFGFVPSSLYSRIHLLIFYSLTFELFFILKRKGNWDVCYDGSDGLYNPDDLDKDDPLYNDFEDETKYVLTTTSDAVENGEGANGYDPVADRAVYGPMLTLTEFKIRVSESIKEFFDSADADEVVRGIQEMRCKAFHPEVVKKAISLSLDEGPRERELVSRLLTCLHPIPLEDNDVSKGFDILLDSLDDLSIDIPDAKVRPTSTTPVKDEPFK